MKNILMDICLVLLILMIGSQILDTNASKQQILNQNIQTFEKDVVSGEIREYYTLAKETEPNKVSQFVEGLSDFSREGIKVLVEAFAILFNGF